MSEVVIRCPNCGTTQAMLGECEACHDAEVRYFCTNHSPGRWLDGPACEECGARFGVDRVRPTPRPAPASGGRPRAEPPPTLGSGTPGYDVRERTVDDAWTGPVYTPRRGSVEEIGVPGPGVEWPPPAGSFPPIGVKVVSMGGCVRRLVVLFLVLLALAALAFFGVLGVASRLLFGAGQDMRPVPERVDVAGPEGPLNDQVARVVGRVPMAQRTTVMRALAALHDAYVDELADEAHTGESATCAVAS